MPHAGQVDSVRVVPLLSVVVGLAAALLSACLPHAGRPPVPLSSPVPSPVTPATCGADRLAALRGQPFTRLAEVTLAGELRILRPRQEITGPAQPARLSVRIDETGRVLRLFCD